MPIHDNSGDPTLKGPQPESSALKVGSEDFFSSGKLLSISDDHSGTLSGPCRSGLFAAITDKGAGIQYQDNQDAVFKLDTTDGRLILGVCDGLGGYGGGGLASHLIVRSIAHDVSAGRDLLRAAQRSSFTLMLSYDELAKVGAGAITYANMGATFAACEIKDGTVQFVHAGDAKAVLVRDGEVIHQTHDHTEVQKLIDQGSLKEEDKALHPLNSKMNEAIWLEGGQFCLTHFEATKRELAPGDLVILGSDGLWDMLTTQNVAELSKSEKDPEKLAGLIRQAVRERQEELATRLRKDGVDQKTIDSLDDNVTILVYLHT